MDGSDRTLQKLLASLAEQQYLSSRTNFADLCLIVFRRKQVALIGLMVGAVIGLIVFFVQPTLYETRVIIQVGQFGPDKAVLEPAESVAERLKAQYSRDYYSDEEAAASLYLKEVKVNKNAKQLFTAVAVGKEPRQAEQFLKKIVDKLLAEHGAQMETVLAADRMLLQALSSQVREARSDIKVAEQRAEQAVRQGRSTEATALTVEKSRLGEHAAKLDQKRTEAQARLAEFESKGTRVIRGPTTAKPAGMGPWIYALLGALGGFVAGIVVALFVELFSATRRVDNLPADKAG